MSRSLEESAAALEREARLKVKAVRRAVREYNRSLEASRDDCAQPVLDKQQEMERVVAEYIKLYKAIKRIHKKLRSR
jgi:hypothetical protein